MIKQMRAWSNNPCYGLHWHQDRPFTPPAGLFEATHGMRANPSERRMKQRVLRYMQRAKIAHVDPLTGEANYTGLAEDAAGYFESWHWLDDPDHWVWDLAIQAVDPDPRFRFNPRAYCGHAPGRVTAAMKRRWKDADFGLIEWERAKRGGQRRSGHRGRWHKRRKYPVKYSALAANAKARAEAAYEEGYLTRPQLNKIVRKANRVLRACGGIY